MTKGKALICTDVCRIAFDNEKVTLESDDTVVIMHMKNQEEHGQFEKGNEYSVALGNDVVAKPKSKKKTSKKAAKKTSKKATTTEAPAVAG